jgi:hypothetical protein
MADSGLVHSASLLTAALLAPVLMAAAPDPPGGPCRDWRLRGTGVLAAAPPALAAAAHAGLPAAAGLRRPAGPVPARHRRAPGEAGVGAGPDAPPVTSALAWAFAVYQFSSHTWAGDIDVPTAVIIPSRARVVRPDAVALRVGDHWRPPASRPHTPQHSDRSLGWRLDHLSMTHMPSAVRRCRDCWAGSRYREDAGKSGVPFPRVHLLRRAPRRM